MAVVQLRVVQARVVTQNRFGHGHALEPRAEVDAPALVIDMRAAEHRRAQLAQHGLGQVHQLAVVGVRAVEFQHGEFGVVFCADAFVAEVAVDFKHALEAADNQAFEIQLRRDAQEQRHVQRVVVGGERPRQRAAGNGVEHRRLDFQKTARGHELAQVANDCGARFECLAAGIVHD